MQDHRVRLQSIRPGRFSITVLLIALHGLLLFLSADARAHAALHADATHPGHECVLTLLTEGKVSLAGEAVQAPRCEPVVAGSLPLPLSVARPGPMQLLPPSCGPPGAAV